MTQITLIACGHKGEQDTDHSSQVGNLLFPYKRLCSNPGFPDLSAHFPKGTVGSINAHTTWYCVEAISGKMPTFPPLQTKRRWLCESVKPRPPSDQTGSGKLPAHAEISFLSSLISSTSPLATFALKSFSLFACFGNLAWTSLQMPIH